MLPSITTGILCGGLTPFSATATGDVIGGLYLAHRPPSDPYLPSLTKPFTPPRWCHTRFIDLRRLSRSGDFLFQQHNVLRVRKPLPSTIAIPPLLQPSRSLRNPQYPRPATISDIKSAYAPVSAAATVWQPLSEHNITNVTLSIRFAAITAATCSTLLQRYR